MNFKKKQQFNGKNFLQTLLEIEPTYYQLEDCVFDHLATKAGRKQLMFLFYLIILEK